MTHRSTLTALLVLLAGAGAAAQTAITGETVLARVGPQPVTRAQLTTQLFKYYGKNALDQLVNRSVVVQEAARYKVEVPDSAIDARVAQAKRQGGADFAAAMEAQGVTEAMLRDRFRADLLVEGLLDKKWPVKDSDLVRLSVRYARLQTERVARDLIQEAQLSKGRNFELLVLQRSLDKEEGGMVQPNPFLRIDNPAWFKIADEAIRDQGLSVGQITRKPVPSKEFFLVIKLEGYLGPETLKGAERERVMQRIRAARLPALVPTSRKRYKIEQPVALAQLISDPKLPGDTVVARVTGPGADAKPDTITRKQLDGFLVESFGRTALEQLVDRAMTTQLAAKVKATVSEAEVTDRINAVKKSAGEKAFQDALAAEGITEDAWRERVRFTTLAEKTVNTRAPLTQNDFVRLTARYIRVGSKEEAQAVLQQAQGTQAFDQLAKMRSLDRNSDGFVKPRLFLRQEQPEIFKALEGVTAGQVSPRALEVAGSYYILKLEGRFGPDTLTAKERDDAMRRINALRMGPLLDTWRKEIKVEYPVPMKAVVAAARA